VSPDERIARADRRIHANDAARNRELWTRVNAEYTDTQAVAKWAQAELTWGIWDIPESALGAPLGDVGGLDVVELGCGTAYVSAVLAKQGARPVGVDITPAQLATARRCMAATGIEFPLVEADAGETGLPAESFDLAVSEYGASIWIEPERFVSESARLLRPGGRLVFMCNSTLLVLCSAVDGESVGERLVRPQFGIRRLDWAEDGVDFHLPAGERIDLLHAHGFEVDRLIEVPAPEGAETHPYYSYVPADWGRRWPAEELWLARKR
jgi:SAM-dependent methyltransferase